MGVILDLLYLFIFFGFNVERLNLGLVCFKKEKKTWVGESSVLLFNQ